MHEQSAVDFSDCRVFLLPDIHPGILHVAITTLIRRISDVGIAASAQGKEIRCVRLLNLLMSVSLLFIVAYAAFFLIATPKLSIVAWSALGYVPLIAGVFLLHRRGAFLAARVAAPVITTLLVGQTVLFLGAHLNFQYFFFATVLGIFFTFPSDQARYMYLLLPIPLCAFVLLDWMGPAGMPVPAEVTQALKMAGTAGIASLLTGFIYYAYSVNRDAESRLSLAVQKSDRLLLNVLPETVAEQLKEGSDRIVERFESVSVIFADIAGFTPASERYTPEELIDLLDAVFTRFDAVVAARGLEKIKTIGDAYMAAAGLPERRADHCRLAALAALDMLAATADLETSTGLRMRIGMNTGEAIAGVIGRHRFIYDVWGDTVNTASRMESHGLPGRIHVTRAVRDTLQGQFLFEERGRIEIKGKGLMETFFLMRTEDV